MIIEEEAEKLWASREFGHAELGNTLRTKRLVAMASRAAAAPAGRVTQVFSDAAEREGAYRFIENPHVDSGALVRAAAQASARRAQGQPFVYVPVDGTSLTLQDQQRVRGLGPIGTYTAGARGLKIMNAIIVGSDGTPLGLGHQVWWTRPATAKENRRKRLLKEKETHRWLETIRAVQQVWVDAGSASRLWFQLDREGDFHQLLSFAANTSDWVTLRANHDRRVRDHRGRRLKLLLREAPFLGQFKLPVPASPHRRARLATISVRATRVTLRLFSRPSGRSYEVKLDAVLARESRTTPHGERPIEWLLLTNRRTASFGDALAVVRGYAHRWKIEQFHRTWKSTCRLQDTQLRSPESIIRWATLLASVAMRIERLRDLARNSPDEPATIELATHEIEALTWLRATGHPPHSGIPSIAEAVVWIAQLGGYTGKSSGGPPGATTLGRGLQRLESAAIVVLNQRAHGPGKT